MDQSAQPSSTTTSRDQTNRETAVASNEESENANIADSAVVTTKQQRRRNCRVDGCSRSVKSQGKTVLVSSMTVFDSYYSHCRIVCLSPHFLQSKGVCQRYVSTSLYFADLMNTVLAMRRGKCAYFWKRSISLRVWPAVTNCLSKSLAHFIIIPSSLFARHGAKRKLCKISNCERQAQGGYDLMCST